MKNLFLSFFEISVSTSLIVLVLLIFAPLLNRRYASKWKYYIWIALAFRLLIPLNLDLSLRPVVIKIPERITSPILTNNEPGISITLQTEQKFTGVTLLDFIAVIWSVVCLCFLFVHFFSFLHFKSQIIRKGTYIENSLTLHQLLKLQKDLQIKNKISIIKYSNAVSPMIIGFFRPILVLPDNEYSQEELFFILKHELIHLKRHDIYFKLLFVIANAIHWFNPLIYIMQTEAGIDMELSCDERVIQGTAYAVRKAYTETLLSTLHKQYKKTNALTTQFYGGNQIMKKRFKNILLKSKKKNGFSILICAISITVILGMMTGCSINSSPSETQKDKESLSKEGNDTTSLNEKPVDNANQTTPTQTPVPEEADSSSTSNPEDVLSEDGQEVKRIAENFLEAYFSGNTETIPNYLTNPYEWDIEAYTGTGTISELTLKGLTNIDKEEIGSTQTISLEFRDSNYEDMFQYFTMEFVKQNDGWKIQFYGIEG